MGSELTFPVTIQLLMKFILLCLFSVSNAVDTITRTRFISDSKNEALISSNGNFKLGFFSPGSSKNRYAGIWFNKVPKQTVAWVSNRETPLKNSNGIFRIADNGNLAVFQDESTTNPIWSTNVTSMLLATDSSTVLLPSGNLALVVRDSVVWQSSDYPTDTVLPGMKFGLNKRTGLNKILSSWKSDDDPAPGKFSFRIDPQSEGSAQIFLFQNSDLHWRGGPWNGGTLSGLPDVRNILKNFEVDFTRDIDIFKYTFEDNEDEISLSFESRNGTVPSLLVLEPLGTVQRLAWWGSSNRDKTWGRYWMAPEDSCDRYAQCESSAICTTNKAAECTCQPGFEPLYPEGWYTKLNCVEKRHHGGCGKGSGEGFVTLQSIKVPDARLSSIYPNLSLKECEKTCLKKCNCTGYASLGLDGSGCRIWYGQLTDMRTYLDGQDFYVRVDSIELAANARKKGHFQTKTFVSISVPVVLGVFVSALCFCFWWRKHSEKKGHREKQKNREMLFLDSAYSLSDQRGGSSKTQHHHKTNNVDVTFFELSTVTAATNNFANKLGQGGFGVVYKGQLQNGQEIAVKRLSTRSGQGVSEFKNEVLLIAKLQHRNLVRLLGCCIEDGEKMLIYEFMPNKSLDYFIFDESRKLTADWKMRFEIIMGIARGILYLHQDSRLRIIHRDLKTSNILLDADMNPKISDFGTARIFGDDDQANTRRVVGTFGYMSPEYVMAGLFSTKSDVFSFGVLLLEIISGKRSVACFHNEPSSSLIRHAWELWRDDKPLELVDSFMVDSCPGPDVVRCIQVGLLCVQDRASDRPNISAVVFMLSNDTKLPSPKEPTFTIRRLQNNQTESSSSGTRSPSINEVTVTVLDAR